MVYLNHAWPDKKQPSWPIFSGLVDLMLMKGHYYEFISTYYLDLDLLIVQSTLKLWPKVSYFKQFWPFLCPRRL